MCRHMGGALIQLRARVEDKEDGGSEEAQARAHSRDGAAGLAIWLAQAFGAGDALGDKAYGRSVRVCWIPCGCLGSRVQRSKNGRESL